MTTTTNGRARRPVLLLLLWLLCSIVCLVGAFGVLLFGFERIGAVVTPDHTFQRQTLLITYFREVVARGLAPQMLIGVALWPVLCAVKHDLEFSSRFVVQWAGLFTAMTPGWIVFPILLGSSGSPLQMNSGLDIAASFVFMTGATSLSTLIPRRFIGALAPGKLAFFVPTTPAAPSS